MLEQLGGGWDVRDVHLGPVFDGGLVVPDALGQAVEQLRLQASAELAGVVAVILETPEEVREDLVNGARAEVAQGQGLPGKEREI